jgi:spoIIIJ-associated protein
MKEAIGWGETITQAQEEACKILGVETHEAEFEILQIPAKKVFGLLGGKLAKVKATVKEFTNVPSLNLNSPSAMHEHPAEIGKNYLIEILNAFGAGNFKVEEKKDEYNGVILNISGEDLRTVIGKRGGTLDALQYLVNLVANTKREDYFRIKLNIGDYREKREQVLKDLGSKIALKAIKTRKKYRLEPMNAYDRRIIHMAVKKYKGVISISQDDGINRHIVIKPENFPPSNQNRKFSLDSRKFSSYQEPATTSR